ELAQINDAETRDPGERQRRELRGELPAERPESRADARLRRAERERQRGGDGLVRQVLEERERERLALAIGELGECRVERAPPVTPPERVGGTGGTIDETREHVLRIDLRARPAPAAAERVRDAEAGDLQDPAPDRAARRVEAR